MEITNCKVIRAQVFMNSDKEQGKETLKKKKLECQPMLVPKAI